MPASAISRLADGCRPKLSLTYVEITHIYLVESRHRANERRQNGASKKYFSRRTNIMVGWTTWFATPNRRAEERFGVGAIQSG